MGKNVIQLDCYNLYQKKKSNQKRKEKKKEFSQKTRVLVRNNVKIQNCLIISLSYNYNTIIILLL